MSSEPPLVRGTTWSASNAASVSPQARHLLPYLSQSALNSSAVKLPELACLAALLLRRLLALADLTFVGITLGPLLAASYVLLRARARSKRASKQLPILVFSCPLLLVLGYLFFVFFLVFSARLDPMGQVGPGFLVLSVLLQVFTPVLLCTRPDADFALLPPASVIELGELFSSDHTIYMFCNLVIY